MPKNFRPFAWCGWLMRVPDDWRPYMIDGDARRGAAGLADEDNRRLILRWNPTGRKPLSSRALDQILLRDAPRRRAKALRASIQSLTHPNLTLRYFRDVDAGVTRVAGWSPISRRSIDILYRHNSPGQDASAKLDLFADLADQPADQPQRWAFFDISFIAPARMTYQASVLKIGDMQVSMQRKRSKGVRRVQAVVRVVYPAGLALSRMPLDQWMEMLLADVRRQYRLPRAIRKSSNPYQSLHTPLGDGLVCDAPLRKALRWTRWTLPPLLRTHLIHDTDRNRLVILQAFAHPTDADGLLAELQAGLHWASP